MALTVEGGVCTKCGSPELAPSSNGDNALPLGTRLAGGRMMVGKKIGSGGFGVTYIAYDHKRGRRIALKEFMPNYLARRQGALIQPKPGSEAVYTRCLNSFMKEARALYELRDHPNIVHVLSAFKENNTAYYTMELLDGETLKIYLERHGRISASYAVRILIPIMNAARYVHSKKMLHRDISPDNIMLCRDPAYPGQLIPKLIDFGAAHVAIQGYSLSYPSVKKRGFSPPEQNWDGKCQGPWTDVYSLAATFYKAVTGEVPISAEDRSVEAVDPLKPPSRLGADVTPEMDRVIMRGLALKYEARYQSMEEMMRDLIKTQKPTGKPQAKERTSVDMRAMMNQPSRPVGRRIGAWFLEHAIHALISILIPMIALGGIAFGNISSLAFYMQNLTFSLGIPVILLILDIILLMTVGGTLGHLISGLKVQKDDRSGNPGFGSALVFALFYCSYGAIVGLICGLVYLASGKDIGPLERLCGLTVGLRHPPVNNPAYVPIMTGSSSSHNADSAPKPQPPVYVDPPKPKTPQSPVSAAYKAVLICREAGESVADWKGRKVTVISGQVLGRSESRAKIVLPESSVGRAHCSFHYVKDSGTWMIRDEGSTNGTIVNDRRLAPMGTAPLKNGSIIRVGKEVFEFRY